MSALMTWVLLSGLQDTDYRDTVYRSKNLRVTNHQMFIRNQPRPLLYHTLMYKQIDFGGNYAKPKRSDWGNPERDFNRLPTTYYYPTSPIGIAMKKFDWFRGKINTYHSDARLPASLVGLSHVSIGSVPVGMLTGLWSEPRVAVLGTTTGTMASYARPLQHFHLFERKKEFAKLARGHKGFFQYLSDAKKRGVFIRLIEGEHRKQFAKHGPKGFYHLIVVEGYKDGIEVIHKELFTKEGMSMLMERLAPGGVLCYHVSNQHYDLVPIIADVANSLKLVAKHGHDQAPRGRFAEYNHYSSGWVMVARDEESLSHLQDPEGYLEELRESTRFVVEPMWTTPRATGKYGWTDKHQPMRGLFRSDPTVRRLISFTNRFERSGQSQIVESVRSVLRNIDRAVVEFKNRPVTQK